MYGFTFTEAYADGDLQDALLWTTGKTCTLTKI